MHLPVGTSNFKKLVECKSLISGEGYLFVDKSEPIREILSDMEFKAVDDELQLTDAANDALLQIKKSKYTAELCSKGINSICSMGIAFSGKAIKIVSN